MNQAEGEDGERRLFPRRPAKAHARQTSKRAIVDGTTLLHAASERDHAEVVVQLLSCLSASGIHVLRADEAGRTAIDVGMSQSVDVAGVTAHKETARAYSCWTKWSTPSKRADPCCSREVATGRCPLAHRAVCRGCRRPTDLAARCKIARPALGPRHGSGQVAMRIRDTWPEAGRWLVERADDGNVHLRGIRTSSAPPDLERRAPTGDW